MFSTKEGAINALESGPTVALNVGELAEALDLITTKLSVAVGCSWRESFSTSTMASPGSDGVNTSHSWIGRDDGSPLGVNLIEESHECLDLINGR